MFLDALGGSPVDHSVHSDGVRIFFSVSGFICVWKVSRLVLLAMARELFNAEYVYNTMASVPSLQQARMKTYLVVLDHFPGSYWSKVDRLLGANGN